MDVLLDPLKCQALVVEAGIGSSVLLEGWSGHETEHTNTVVHGDEDDTLTSILLGVGDQSLRLNVLGAGSVSTTVDPDKNWCTTSLGAGLASSLPLPDVLWNQDIEE